MSVARQERMVITVSGVPGAGAGAACGSAAFRVTPSGSSRNDPALTTIAGVRNSLHGADDIEDSSLRKHRPSISCDAGLSSHLPCCV